jgi:DNA/RNA-binding domain of Phe-tRNA-synthetase-like protein
MPLLVSNAHTGQHYTLMNGTEQALKENDMCMADSQGIISSVIYGPDSRTRIQRETRRVMFVVYAPAGIRPRQIKEHFADIQAYIRLFAPDARQVQQEVL